MLDLVQLIINDFCAICNVVFLGQMYDNPFVYFKVLCYTTVKLRFFGERIKESFKSHRLLRK